MKAVAVSPGKAGNVRLVDMPLPSDGPVLVGVRIVGLDGTDDELVSGRYGEAPPGEDSLVIGHEGLGQVHHATAGGTGDLSPGDWVVATVRRPDPLPCPNCAAGQPDMCLSGLYTERGIKGRHGFLAEFYAEQPQFLVKVPRELVPAAVLLEPLAVVEKAMEQVWRLESRMAARPEKALVLGAGPVGLLSTLLLRLRGLEVYVYDLVEKGVKRELAEAVGARYIWAREHPLESRLVADVGPVDIVVEATGQSPLAFAAIGLAGASGIVCLLGISAGDRTLQIEADRLSLDMVLQNKAVFGSVSANRRHFQAGVSRMREIEARWPGVLPAMITRRLTMEQVASGWQRSPDDLKTVVEVSQAREEM